MTEDNKPTRRSFVGAFFPTVLAAGGGGLGYLLASPAEKKAAHEANKIPSIARQQVAERAKKESMTPEQIIDAYNNKMAELAQEKIPATDKEKRDARIVNAVGIGLVSGLVGLFMLKDEHDQVLDGEIQAESDKRVKIFKDEAERSRAKPAGDMSL